VQRIRGIRQHGDSDGLGYRLLQELQVLTDRLRSHAGQPGDVAARSSQARDEAVAERIADVHHDDGDRRCHALGRESCLVYRRHEHIWLELDKLGRQERKPLVHVSCLSRVPVVDGDVPALDVTQVAQPLLERMKETAAAGRRRPQITDPPDFPGRLGLCGERLDRRPGQRGQQEAAAVHDGTVGRSAVGRKCVAVVHPPRQARPAVARDPHDRPLDASVQLAAPLVLGEEGVPLGQHAHRPSLAQAGGVRKMSAVCYSMTWSARASSDGAIVRLSALAVLRLMTSSNFVACSTGRSAGLAPLRILST
jgi:hypothetical protein